MRSFQQRRGPRRRGCATARAPDPHHFLAEHDVVLADGVATPIEYGWRCYAFGHMLRAGGYGPAGAVFTEDG